MTETFQTIATYQIIPLSSADPEGLDLGNEPQLAYPDALKTAEYFRHQGKAFRVHVRGDLPNERRQRFLDLGALI